MAMYVQSHTCEWRLTPPVETNIKEMFSAHNSSYCCQSDPIYYQITEYILLFHYIKGEIQNVVLTYFIK